MLLLFNSVVTNLVLSFMILCSRKMLTAELYFNQKTAYEFAEGWNDQAGACKAEKRGCIRIYFKWKSQFCDEVCA